MPPKRPLSQDQDPDIQNNNNNNPTHDGTANRKNPFHVSASEEEIVFELLNFVGDRKEQPERANNQAQSVAPPPTDNPMPASMAQNHRMIQHPSMLGPNTLHGNIKSSLSFHQLQSDETKLRIQALTQRLKETTHAATALVQEMLKLQGAMCEFYYAIAIAEINLLHNNVFYPHHSINQQHQLMIDRSKRCLRDLEITLAQKNQEINQYTEKNNELSMNLTNFIQLFFFHQQQIDVVSLQLQNDMPGANNPATATSNNHNLHPHTVQTAPNLGNNTLPHYNLIVPPNTRALPPVPFPLQVPREGEEDSSLHNSSNSGRIKRQKQ